MISPIAVNRDDECGQRRETRTTLSFEQNGHCFGPADHTVSERAIKGASDLDYDSVNAVHQSSPLDRTSRNKFCNEQTCNGENWEPQSKGQWPKFEAATTSIHQDFMERQAIHEKARDVYAIRHRDRGYEDDE
jgi:hypothetical protein